MQEVLFKKKRTSNGFICFLKALKFTILYATANSLQTVLLKFCTAMKGIRKLADTMKCIKYQVPARHNWYRITIHTQCHITPLQIAFDSLVNSN